ncbi:MAG: DUF3060 domain-containing protein [Mycobacterium sp.]
MEQQEDPEDRIRELERPLADNGRTSERGGAPPSGYAYPPPPPGPVPPVPTPSPYNYGYGGPPPGAAPRSPSGNRVWWILAALFVVGVLALVGIIAAYASHRFSRGNLVVPSPTPSTSWVISPPKAIPRSSNPSATQPPGPSVAPLPPQGAELTVTGINENKAVTCNDNILIVSGVSNTVVITGHCVSVTVSGLNNMVTVDAADTIDASGLNNHVTYHSGLPQITKSGDGNVVQQG